MAWARLCYGKRDYSYNYSEFVCDDEKDIETLPTKTCAIGSKAQVIETKTIYILNNNNEWKLFASNDNIENNKNEADSEWNEDSTINFGSIRMTKSRYNSVNDYILKSTDVSKLDSITNAADGSTAICVDTADLYILLMEEWVLFGGSNSSSNSTSSLNLSPLDLTGKTSLDTTEQTDEPETLENDLFTKPDDVTVEPVKGGEELR